MSKKPRVIAVASKLRKKFKDNTPTELYSIWGKNDAIKEILTSFTPNEVAILYFLVTTPIKDLSIAYDVISINMYGVQLISINETDPTIECEDCAGMGYISCDECYGQGYIDCDYCDGGDIECGDCGGDGKDGEGDECGACDGRGYDNCEQCGGDGNYRCQNCSDGDVECSYCDGTGEVTASGKIEYEMKNFLTYNPSLMNQFQDIDEYTKISNELYETMSLDKYNLLITIEKHITDEDEFDDFNDGDCFITQIISPQALALKKGHRAASLYTQSFGII